LTWERWEIRSWHTVDNEIGGITIVAESETRRVEAERALASSLSDLQRAQALGNIGSWRWRMDVTPEEFTASETACRILGRSPGIHLNYEESLALVHPDDVEMVDAIWRQAMSGKPYDQEFRVIVHDDLRWVREQAYQEYDKNGKIIGVFGTLQDITESKNAQDILQASEERLRLALDAAQMGVWNWDLKTGQDNWNDQTFRRIGFQPGSVPTTYATWRQRIHPDDRTRIDAEFKKSLEQKSEQHSVYRVVLDSGEIRWIEARGRPFTNPAGQPVRSFGVMMDVTEQKRAEECNMLLTAEVNHRAKNLLAVVQAVALQTAREDDPKEFAENFSERLAGLAACHDLLVHSEWMGVDTAALAQSQMQHFANLIGSRVVLDGPPVELNASTAQTLGMAIHELSTNTSKHARYLRSKA
jgi:PAS domain S-box-containing protein